MNRWLFKTDPDIYSWNDLASKKSETWDGVSNHLALKHLRSVKKGDEIFIYHTGDEKSVIGVAQAVSDPYTDKKINLAVIDIAPVRTLKKPVPLSLIKTDPKLKSWELARLGRLSVMPVSDAQWNEVLRLSGS